MGADTQHGAEQCYDVNLGDGLVNLSSSASALPVTRTSDGSLVPRVAKYRIHGESCDWLPSQFHLWAMYVTKLSFTINDDGAINDG